MKIIAGIILAALFEIIAAIILFYIIIPSLKTPLSTDWIFHIGALTGWIALIIFLSVNKE